MHRPSVIPRVGQMGERCSLKRTQPVADGLKMEKDSHKPRNMDDFLEMGKERKLYPSETSGL